MNTNSVGMIGITATPICHASLASRRGPRSNPRLIAITTTYPTIATPNSM